MFRFHCRSFCRVGLLLCLASASQGQSQDCFSQVKSKKWHHICWRSVQFPWCCLTTAKIWNFRPVLQLSYSSLLFGKQRKIHSWGVRVGWPKRCKEKRERRLSFGSSLYMFYRLPLSLPHVNWASQEGCLLHLRSSLWSSELPLFHFHKFIPSLSFQFSLATVILDSFFSYSNYLTLVTAKVE